MTPTNRNILSLAVITVALLAGITWSLLYLSDATDDADHAAADTRAARSSVQRIQASRPANLQSNAQEQLAGQLPKRLDDAMKSAGIDAENLDRISPQPARHFGPGDLNQMSLQLVFHQTPLRNVLLFLSALSNDNRWLSVTSVHFTRPASATAPAPTSDWDVELTVSYLTNSPGTGTAPTN